MANSVKTFNKVFIDNILEVRIGGEDDIVQIVDIENTVRSFDLKKMAFTDKAYVEDEIIWKVLRDKAGKAGKNSAIAFDGNVEFLGADGLRHRKATDFEHPVNFQTHYYVNNAVHTPVGRDDGTRVNNPVVYSLALSAYLSDAASGIKLFDERLFTDQKMCDDMIYAYKTYNSLFLEHDAEDGKAFAKAFSDKVSGALERTKNKAKEEAEVDKLLSGLKF